MLTVKTQRWEYLILDLPDTTGWSHTSLNAHGKDGWELVTVVNTNYNGLKAYMKRPKKD